MPAESLIVHTCDGKNLIGTVFDDEATLRMGSGGTAPYTGSFRLSSSALSMWDGTIANGSWTLRITDTTASNNGTLLNWSLQVRERTLSSALADSNLLAAAVDQLFADASNPRKRR